MEFKIKMLILKNLTMVRPVKKIYNCKNLPWSTYHGKYFTGLYWYLPRPTLLLYNTASPSLIWPSVNKIIDCTLSDGNFLISSYARSNAGDVYVPFKI